MSRKKKFIDGREILSLLLLKLLLIPLLLLKQIGQLFILTTVYILSSILATYNLFFYLIKSILFLPFALLKGILISLIQSLKKSKYSLSFSFYKMKRKRKERKISGKKLSTFALQVKFFLLGSGAIILFLMFLNANSFVKNLPNPDQILIQGFPATTKILDRNGILLYEIYDNYDRTPIKLTQIPKHVIYATLAAEDKEFYLHNGISLRGITRALIHNLTTDSLEGGSTITQQLIRSTYLSPEKTFLRKTKEIILSVWIEQIYNKNQILEMYLNQVPYGGTAWGIESAAKTFFGKSAAELTLAEAAFLSGLPASPSNYSPLSNKQNIKSGTFKKRQIEILNRMLREKFISKSEYEDAKNSKLIFKKQRTPIAAPHFVMYVRDLLNKYYGRRLTETGGLRVVTTLDLTLQEKAQQIVSEEIEKLHSLQVTNGATLITDPKTGEILTMIGSKDYFDHENNGNYNVTTSERQPGSAIKVVNFAAALENGLTAATIINDSPVTYQIPGAPPYKPVNYDGRFHGPVTLRTALGSSYNIPFVKILNSIGVDKMIEFGKKMGIDTWDETNRFGLSLTLGGGEVTMLDMAEVYGTLANGGKRQNLNPFIKVTDINAKELPIPQAQPVRALPETVAFIISNILADNNARSPAFGSNSLLNIPGKNVSVKTGTSDNKRDNWAIGYTRDIVVTVWVGNNDNSPMNERLTSGVTGAAPIWRTIMDVVLKDLPNNEMTVPPGIITVKCNNRSEYFIKYTVDQNPCNKKIYAKSEDIEEVI